MGAINRPLRRIHALESIGEEECVVGRTRVAVECEDEERVVCSYTTEEKVSGQDGSNNKKR